MNNEVMVSVVIPTYSRSVTLERAISSVLAQTHQKLEIIIVDDNPVDSEWRASTEKLMQKYIVEPRIRYLKNAQNIGGAGARNVGIKATRGEYIAFLDDDDEYLPEKVEKQLDIFLNTASDRLALVYCHAKFINDDGSSTYSDTRNFHGNCLYEAIEANCIAATSQWMVKKSAVEAVGMFTVVPCKQDSQLILKLLAAGYEVEVVPEELSLYYNIVMGARISGSSLKNIKGEELYRIECRKQYYKLEDWQILNVEYAFAVRFYEFFRRNKMTEETKHEWKIMKKAG